MKSFTLSKVIQEMDQLDWRDAIYVHNKGETLTKETNLIIADPDEGEVEVGVKEFNSKKYFYLLSVQAIQDVLENANQQKSDATLNDYITAINFYIKNDAHIDLKVKL